MSETRAEQLDRVRLMASGNDKWDLSPNDIEALTTLVSELERRDANVATLRARAEAAEKALAEANEYKTKYLSYGRNELAHAKALIQLATLSRLSRALVDKLLDGTTYPTTYEAIRDVVAPLAAALESQAGQAGEKTSALDDTLAKLPAVPARPCDQCGRYDIEWWGQGIGCNHCVGPKPPTDFFERLGEKPSRVVALPSASATAAGEEKSK